MVLAPVSLPSCFGWSLAKGELEEGGLPENTVLARLALLSCGRGPGAEAQLEGLCCRCAQGWGTLLANQAESVVQAGYPQVSMYLGWGTGKGMTTLLCSCRSLPRIPAPPSQAVRLVNRLHSRILQMLFKLLASGLCLHRAVCCAVSLRQGLPFPPTLPVLPSQAR